MSTRNWDNYGIAWETETVKKGDKEYVGAEIPTVKDLQKFVSMLKASGGDVVNILNMSNSIRVASQDVKRNNPNIGRDELRERIWNRLSGIRAARSATKTIVVVLPDGKKYEGTSRVDLIAAYLAAAVDVGIPAEVARGIAERTAEAAGLVAEEVVAEENN